MLALVNISHSHGRHGTPGVRKQDQPPRAPASGGLARQQRRDPPRRPARLRRPRLRRDLGPRAEPATRGEPQPALPAVRVEKTTLAGDRRPPAWGGLRPAWPPDAPPP